MENKWKMSKTSLIQDNSRCFSYIKLKGGFPLLASPLTGLFYAMTKEVKDGRLQKEYRLRGRKAR